MKKNRLDRVRWCPELALFDSEEERKAVIKQFRRRAWRTRRYWVQALGFVLAASVIYSLLMFSAMSAARLVFPGVPQFVSSGLAGVLIGGFSGFAVQFLWRRPLQRYLREQLIAKGVPICIECGYDLRGQVDPRCPECGRAFDPGLIRPRTTPAGSDQTND